MSSNDLEGDDIWGDSGGSGGGGNDESKSSSEETKTADAGTSTNMDAAAAEESPPAAAEDLEDEETRHMSVGELRQRIHLLNNDIRIMKSDVQRITHESRAQRDRIRENQEKVKLNKQLPYLVANVVEILEPDAEDGAFAVVVVLLPTFCVCVCVPCFVCFKVAPFYDPDNPQLPHTLLGSSFTTTAS